MGFYCDPFPFHITFVLWNGLTERYYLWNCTTHPPIQLCSPIIKLTRAQWSELKNAGCQEQSASQAEMCRHCHVKISLWEHPGGCEPMGLWGEVGSQCVLHHQQTCHRPCVIAMNRTDKSDPGFWSGLPTLALTGLICECYRSGGLLHPEAMQRGQVITERPSKRSSQSQLGSTSHSVWSPLSIFTDTLNIWRGPAPSVWTVTRRRPNTCMSRKRVPESVHSLIVILQLCQLDVTQSCYTPETVS